MTTKMKIEKRIKIEKKEDDLPTKHPFSTNSDASSQNTVQAMIKTLDSPKKAQIAKKFQNLIGNNKKA